MPKTTIKPRDMNIVSPVPWQMLVYNNDWQFSTSPWSGSAEAIRQTVFLATNTGNNYSITWTWITSYNEAQSILFRVSQRNTWPATMNIDWLGALPLVSVTGEILQPNALRENDTYTIRRESDINKLVVAWQANVNQATQWVEFVGVIVQWAVNYPITGATNTDSVVYDGDRYIYVTNSSDWLVYKFDTRTNTFVPPNASVPWAWYYCSYHAWFLYVWHSSSNLMRKVDVSTMTVVATLTLTWIRHTSCVEWWFLYTISNWWFVQKISLATFTLASETNNLSSSSAVPSIITDWSHLYAYSWLIVRKMNIWTLTTVADYNTWVSGSATTVFSKWSFVYISTWPSMSIRKINKSTMTLTAQTSFTTSVFWMADFDDDHIIVAYDTTSTIGKININTMTQVWTPISIASRPQEIIKIWWRYYAGNELAPVWLNIINFENITPPAPWHFRLYFKTNGKLYRMDSSGNEELIWTQT